VPFFLKDRLVYKHDERHYVRRTGWLRAAVLGANDGIISVSSLVIGVASAAAGDKEILVAGVAGLVAGALSMAAGEYVSVSSQADLENADLARERKELVEIPEDELQELADIYVDRGVDPDLAREVSKQMMAKDALATHAREELGISELTTAKPLQASLASAASFSLGAAIPVLSILFLPKDIFIPASSALCILLLGCLGAFAAKTGGAPVLKPALRVMFWGAVAMGFTALVGNLFGSPL
jgi:VIT1/CCC1 family predicted Fe2+/Mn2+ transporter